MNRYGDEKSFSTQSRNRCMLISLHLLNAGLTLSSCQCHLKTHLSSYPWETSLITEIRPERMNISPSLRFQALRTV